MPRFRHTAAILNLMSKKESIRNLGMIAHVDHGKTTLTDSLLAGTGLLSPQAAGSVRVLDYLEEEQKRGITLKTTNISLLYQTADSAFIINLVDTPGHVDFTGKVARALRNIDGAVVLVDAVEEVMSQTELVVRQALEERVRPVLFINKVDRLITELRLNAQQIEKKLIHIISNFNDLIEIHGESGFKEKWKVNPTEDSIAIGSALHKWGLTLSAAATQKAMKFADIIRAYKTANHKKLQKLLPLYSAILDMAVRHVPNPREAQKYRLEKIWKGNMTSDIGQAMTNCDDKGPTLVCLTDVQQTPNSDSVATGRVFSGTVKTGEHVYLVNAQKESVINQVSVFMGAFREPVDQMVAGNLVALEGLELAKAGETVVSAKYKKDMVPFEQVRYISEPVVTLAVEPENPAELSELVAAIGQLANEDPNLAVSVSKETGEHLLSGMGELHLEIAVKHLRDKLDKIRLSVSSPRVVYREKVTRKGIVATALSPNQQNRFTVQVEPFTKNAVNALEYSKTLEIEKVIAVNEHGNVLVDRARKTDQLPEVLDFIISGFTFACNSGPLCGEPMRGVQVNLLGIQLSENKEQCSPVEVMHGVGKAAFGSFLTAEPILLEPVYKTVISAPTELAGFCSRIVSSRRGKISAFKQKGTFTVITSSIPVEETFGLSTELRSATSGRAFWQSIFDRWEKMPEKLQTKKIKNLRKRKGLPSTVPIAKRFLEENP